MKKFLSTVIHILFITTLLSAQGYNIEVNLKSATNKEVYLAHHYISKIYIDDTLQLNTNGSGIFKGDSLLHQGLYKIYLDDNNHFDFLLGPDQDFTITNNTFSSTGIQINGSSESEEFAKYMVFLKELQETGAQINEKLKNAADNEKAKLREEGAGLTTKLHNYWDNVSKTLPNTFLTKFLYANDVPKLDISTLPESTQNNDSLLLLARFNYQQKHFWDNFDYTDPRFLYTPLFKPKLETWFTKVLYQNYDSVKPYVYKFIEEVKHEKRIFQFVTSFFLNSSINSNIMGLDALFIDLANDYYLSGDAFWANEESLKKIKENVLFIENNLIGKIAPNLNMEGFDGEFFELHQIDKKHTAVLIYEPNCSHCKEFVPQFYNDVYLKHKDKGFEVFAIYSMDNKEEWSDFLTEHKLWDWLNVWDKDHLSRFKILYDARKTPGIFLLDENKKIIAKKLTIEQIDKLLEFNLY